MLSSMLICLRFSAYGNVCAEALKADKVAILLGKDRV